MSKKKIDYIRTSFEKEEEKYKGTKRAAKEHARRAKKYRKERAR